MKIAFVYTTNRLFWTYLYAKYRWLDTAEYHVQLGTVLDEPYGSHSGWQPVLKSRGHECETFFPGMVPLENAWMRENGLSNGTYPQSWRILIDQLRAFQPDVVYCSLSNNYHISIVDAIRDSVSSIRAIINYAGSFTYDIHRLAKMHAVVTCSKEIRDALTDQGLRTYYVPHSFDMNVTRLVSNLSVHRSNKMVFAGGLVRRKGLHMERERLLENVVEAVPMAVYTPAFLQSPVREAVDWTVRKVASKTAGAILSIPAVAKPASLSFALRRLSRVELPSTPMVSTKLRKTFRPPVYGMDSYRMYMSYAVTLNHSGEYRTAENLRLFEATGVGACLLTDWKINLPDYFDIDSEIVTYKNAEECTDKATWLLSHPEEARRIGEAAKQKCTTQHTFENKVELFESILNEMVKN